MSGPFITWTPWCLLHSLLTGLKAKLLQGGSHIDSKNKVQRPLQQRSCCVHSPLSDIRDSTWLFSLRTHACRGDPAPCRAPAYASAVCHLSALMLSPASGGKFSPLGSPCSLEEESLTTMEMKFLKNIFWKTPFPWCSAFWNASGSWTPAWRLLLPPLPPAWGLFSCPVPMTQQWLLSNLMQLKMGGRLNRGVLCSSAGPWRQPCCTRRCSRSCAWRCGEAGFWLEYINLHVHYGKLSLGCWGVCVLFFWGGEQAHNSCLPLYFKSQISNMPCLRFLCVFLRCAIYFLGLTLSRAPAPGIKR